MRIPSFVFLLQDYIRLHSHVGDGKVKKRSNQVFVSNMLIAGFLRFLFTDRRKQRRDPKGDAGAGPNMQDRHADDHPALGGVRGPAQ
jgi:hypothetical protein